MVHKGGILAEKEGTILMIDVNMTASGECALSALDSQVLRIRQSERVAPIEGEIPRLDRLQRGRVLHGEALVPVEVVAVLSLLSKHEFRQSRKI